MTDVRLDFNELSAGTLVNGQYVAQGVTISSGNPHHPVMIFDTAHPTGGDYDLATSNLGNVLILSEDRDSCDPDDNAGGGSFFFTFDTPARVEELTFLDIEEGSLVCFYDADGQLISQQNVGPTANNGQTTAQFGVDGVTTMQVYLPGSGAVDNLVFDLNGDPIAETDCFVVRADEAFGDIDGNVITDDTGWGADSDPDGDPLTVVAVNGDVVNVGTPVEGNNGGLFIINSDGTVDFDANGAFDGLGLGESAQTSVTYTISDGNGGTDTATAIFLVRGVNDGTVQGTGGDDVITPGYVDADGDEVDGNDAILAGDAGDDDLILGFGGNDLIDAGLGDDEVHGGSGDDTLIGGAGADRLMGGEGSDTFVGGTGGDIVVGGEDPNGHDVDVLDLSGSGVDRIDYTNGDSESGIVTFLDGTTMMFSEIENVVPCFTPGTHIATPTGERLVEDLRVGDRVITRDNGIQEIAWVGHKPLSGKELAKSRHLRPILIKAGALGHGLPERDMMVSPNHRVLVSSEMTQLYFEEREVLAAAKHMVGAAGIHSVDVVQTTYVHFMFERHEVVLSDGAWTESFQPGDHSLKGLGNSQRNEIFELFPELSTQTGLNQYQAARKSLKRHEARLLVHH